MLSLINSSRVGKNHLVTNQNKQTVFAHPTSSYSLFPIPDSRLPTPDSRLPTPYSRLPAPE
ncbi:MAG: hypothetical protein F6J90_13540 [Moorea sp. SIOASIH]|nr:hypothetical protein [Moorena sp. SIOASIH]